MNKPKFVFFFSFFLCISIFVLLSIRFSELYLPTLLLIFFKVTIFFFASTLFLVL